MFSHLKMSTSEVPNPKDPEIVDSLLLDLLDPENKAYALSMLPKVILFLLYIVYSIPLIFIWHNISTVIGTELFQAQIAYDGMIQSKTVCCQF